MKRSFWTVAALAAAVTTISCKEDSKASVVWGSVSALGTEDIHGNKGPVTVNGYTLGKSGEDLVGFCQYKDGEFSFAFGSDSPTNFTLSTDYYFTISGIEGPPSDAPYDADGNPRTDEGRSFANGEIYTSAGAWHIDEEYKIPGECLVGGFAKGTEGNLTPLEFGKKPFDYMVNIDCDQGLTGVPSELEPTEPAAELGGFKMTVWFKGCET